MDAALDRHVTVRTCYQHALHRPATPSLIHEPTEGTAYFDGRSMELRS